MPRRKPFCFFCFKSTRHHHNYICYPPVAIHAEQIFNSQKNVIILITVHCAAGLSRSESFPVNVDNRKWKWTQISTKCETMFNWNFSTLRANLKVEHLWRNQKKICTNSESSVKTKLTLTHFSQCWWKIKPWHDSVGSLILTEWHFSFETGIETKNVTLLTLTFWFRNQKCHTLTYGANKVFLGLLFWFHRTITSKLMKMAWRVLPAPLVWFLF